MDCRDAVIIWWLTLQIDSHERECAAAELKRLQQMDGAETLRTEALLARRYMNDEICISAEEGNQLQRDL